MSGMILDLLASADNISKQFVFNGYSNLVSSYRTAMIALAGLSITIFGFAVINGWVSLSKAEMMKRLLIMGGALSLALHWDFFSEYIFNLLTIAPDQIGIHLVQSIPGSSYNDQTSLYGALQDYFYKGMKYGDDVWKNGGVLKGNLMPYLWAILMWIMTIVFAAVALFELIIGKFGLAIFLVISPLVIPMIMFQSTKSAIFDGWLKGTITFALIPIFVMAAVTLSLMLDGHILKDVQNSIITDSLTISDLAPYILCTIVNVALLFQATSMAATVGGGLSAGIGQGVAGFAAGYLTKALSGGGKAAGKFVAGKLFGGKGNKSDKGKDEPSNKDESSPSN